MKKNLLTLCAAISTGLAFAGCADQNSSSTGTRTTAAETGAGGVGGVNGGLGSTGTGSVGGTRGSVGGTGGGVTGGGHP